MRAELTKDGLTLIAQCNADDSQLYELWSKGHLHFVCKARVLPEKKWATKLKHGTLLLTPSILEWRMVPLGKRHGSGDARRRRVT